MKKLIAYFLAAFLAVSSVMGPFNTVFGAELERIESVGKSESGKLQNVKDAEELSDEEKIEDKSDPTVVETDSSEEDESKEETDKEKNKNQNKNRDRDSQKTEKETEVKKDTDESGTHKPQGRSLLPLKEVRAYLVLNEYPEEKIKNMPLNEVLNLLRDSEGNHIEIPNDATAVWTYFKDENDNIIQDEYHVIDKNETVDLSLFEYTNDYTMELIVGSGSQLDPDNIRYLVKVYLTNEIAEKLTYELYTQDENGIRTKIVPDDERTTHSNTADMGFDMEIATTIFTVKDHMKGTEYYLGLTSLADQHPNIKADVYTIQEFQKFLYNGTGNPITDQMLNQDMSQINAGYKGYYAIPEDIYDAFNNQYFLVYTDIVHNSIISFSCIMFAVSEIPLNNIISEVFDYENGKRQEVICENSESLKVEEFAIDLSSGEVVSASSVYNRYYMLEKGYSADEEYYCVLDAKSNIWDDANSHTVKAVEGLYDSLEEAAGQPDIKEKLIPAERVEGEYGYKANYNAKNGGVNFTVFFDDGAVWRLNIKIIEYNPKADLDYIESFNQAPIIGEADPWFRVTGVNDAKGNPLDAYIVENGKEINMDTMYGYGYQTVLINDNVSELQPVIDMADSDEVKVTSVYINDGHPFYPGDIIQCTQDETDVTFHVTIEDNNGVHTKNYNVSFVKKSSGSKLYVTDPKGGGENDTVRSVFLDEYFEYKHDILIANTGDEPLTGLRVELNATNCKLDDYWIIGGEGNDTLSAFDTTKTSTVYGELPNLAKIRLLPDGDGDIEGTLTIYADGQEPVIIQLSGRAQNPKITTEDLDDAVKYVPYSYMVTTNNMYDWTEVNFSLSGELPEGVEFIEKTGEIYGVPQETGTFPVTVTADFTSDTYEFESSTVELTLNVQDNTNTNVYESTDSQYQILESIGEDVTGEYDFVLTEIDDQLFVSNGEFDEFQDLWLNGEKLVDGVDYTKEEGSTRITISSQTFENKVNKDGTNTLAAEFRVDNERENELKRTAQNFRLDLSQENPSDNTSDDQKNPTGDDDGQDSGGNRQSNKNTGGNQNTGNSSYNGKRVIPARNTGSSGNGSSVDTDTEDQSTVTMYTQLVDAEDSPLENYTIEIHSTPKEAVTNEKGVARFNDVEFGSHTITVKDSNGKTAAVKKFEIQKGTVLSLDKDVITAKRGSAFVLKITLDAGELRFTGIKAKEVQTNDGSNILVWSVVFLIATVAVVGIPVYFRKRKLKYKAM